MVAVGSGWACRRGAGLGQVRGGGAYVWAAGVGAAGANLTGADMERAKFFDASVLEGVTDAGKRKCVWGWRDGPRCHFPAPLLT